MRTLITIVSILVITCSAMGKEFFVSPVGDDASLGTKDQPFQTPHRARDAARMFAGKEAVTIWLREGTYYLDKTLVLGPEDSGAPDAPLVYAAYNGEKPAICGGTEIKANWRPYKDGIYSCSLADMKLQPGDLDQLFVDGKRQIRTRYPNGDPDSPDWSNWDLLAGADMDDKARAADCENLSSTVGLKYHQEVYYNPETFTKKHWSHPEEGILHAFPLVGWNTLMYRLRGLVPARNALLIKEGGWQQHERFAKRPGTTLGKGSRFMVENIFEELDAPKEWYFDKRTSTLYYMPESGVDPNRVTISVAGLRRLVAFSGSREHPVHDIRMKGIRFSQTRTTYLDAYSLISMGDWAIVHSGAVHFEGAENCAVTDCFFDAVSGNGLYMNNYNKAVCVQNCVFSEIGDTAIAITGKSRLNKDLSYECKYCGHMHGWGFDPYNEDYPRECVIDNNKIYNVGVYGKQTAGVFFGMAARITISHNEMYNIPRAAICIHDGMYGGHVIENNFLHHSCRETREHGTFNSWGRDQWWCHNQSHGPADHLAGDVKKDTRYTNILRNNLIIDNKGWGIDLDDGSSNYHIYNNVCLGVAIKNREGDFRTVENNIVINAGSSGIQVGCSENSDVWRHNIIHNGVDFPENFPWFKGTQQPTCMTFTKPPRKQPWVQKMDYNCYFSKADAFMGKGGKAGTDLQTWRKQGYDQHSLFADPMFVSPDKLDFRVRPESPALKLGFKNFPMDQFGLTKDFPDTWEDDAPDLPPYYAGDDAHTEKNVEDNKVLGMGKNKR